MANKAARKMFDFKDVEEFMFSIGFLYTGKCTGDHKQYNHPLLNLNYSIQRVTQTSLNDISNRIRLAFLTYICCGQEFDQRGINGDIINMVKRNFNDCQREPQKAFSDEQRKTLGIENDSDATMWILRRRAEIISRHPEIQVKLPQIPKEWEKFIVEEEAPQKPQTKNGRRAKIFDWRAQHAFYANYEENNPESVEGEEGSFPADDDSKEPI